MLRLIPGKTISDISECITCCSSAYLRFFSKYCEGISAIWSQTSLSQNGLFIRLYYVAGVQLEGDLDEILALGAKILPFISLREKWESP